MDTSRLEELLEELVSQGASIIVKLDDIAAAVTEMKEELNWVGEYAFAKRVLDQLSEIESAVRDIAI